jgi:hypothetical protein
MGELQSMSRVYDLEQTIFEAQGCALLVDILMNFQWG